MREFQGARGSLQHAKAVPFSVAVLGDLCRGSRAGDLGFRVWGRGFKV